MNFIDALRILRLSISDLARLTPEILNQVKSAAIAAVSTDAPSAAKVKMEIEAAAWLLGSICDVKQFYSMGPQVLDQFITAYTDTNDKATRLAIVNTIESNFKSQSRPVPVMPSLTNPILKKLSSLENIVRGIVGELKFTFGDKLLDAAPTVVKAKVEKAQATFEEVEKKLSQPPDIGEKKKTGDYIEDDQIEEMEPLYRDAIRKLEQFCTGNANPYVRALNKNYYLSDWKELLEQVNYSINGLISFRDSLNEDSKSLTSKAILEKKIPKAKLVSKCLSEAIFWLDNFPVKTQVSPDYERNFSFDAFTINQLRMITQRILDELKFEFTDEIGIKDKITKTLEQFLKTLKTLNGYAALLQPKFVLGLVDVAAYLAELKDEIKAAEGLKTISGDQATTLMRAVDTSLKHYEQVKINLAFVEVGESWVKNNNLSRQLQKQYYRNYKLMLEHSLHLLGMAPNSQRLRALVKFPQDFMPAMAELLEIPEDQLTNISKWPENIEDLRQKLLKCRGDGSNIEVDRSYNQVLSMIEVVQYEQAIENVISKIECTANGSSRLNYIESRLKQAQEMMQSNILKDSKVMDKNFHSILNEIILTYILLVEEARRQLENLAQPRISIDEKLLIRRDEVSAKFDKYKLEFKLLTDYFCKEIENIKSFVNKGYDDQTGVAYYEVEGGPSARYAKQEDAVSMGELPEFNGLSQAEKDEMLKLAYESAQREARSMATRENDPGACAISLVLAPNQNDATQIDAHVSHLGDCTAFYVELLPNEDVRCTLINSLHNPENLNEVARVTSEGGAIQGNRLRGAHGAGLAVTGAVGDFNIPAMRRVPEQHLLTLPINPNAFFVLACDGLTEAAPGKHTQPTKERFEAYLSNAIKLFIKSGKSLTSQNLVKWLADTAMKDYSSDNISVCAWRVQPIQTPIMINVFDGHGGDLVSKMLARILMERVRRFSASPALCTFIDGLKAYIIDKEEEVAPEKSPTKFFQDRIVAKNPTLKIQIARKLLALAEDPTKNINFSANELKLIETKGQLKNLVSAYTQHEGLILNREPVRKGPQQ